MMFKRLILILFCFTLNSLQAQTDSVADRSAWDKTQKNTKELIKLLTDPLDLKAFEKQNKMHSNSGGANKQVYYLKPNDKGFYYRYFLFNNMYHHGPMIITFQKDPKMQGYMDSSEVFIELSCDKPFKSLGKMDLAGQSLPETLKKLGSNYIKEGKLWAFQYNSTLLILSGSDKIDWFKVVKLNKSFKNFEELKSAKELLEYRKF